MNTLDLIAKHEIDIDWLIRGVYVQSYKLTRFVEKPHNGTDEDKARALRLAIEEIVK